MNGLKLWFKQLICFHHYVESGPIGMSRDADGMIHVYTPMICTKCRKEIVEANQYASHQWRR